MNVQTVLVVIERMFKFDFKISAFGVIVCQSYCYTDGYFEGQ